MNIKKFYYINKFIFRFKTFIYNSIILTFGDFMKNNYKLLKQLNLFFSI